METYISTKVSLVIRIVDDYDLEPIDKGILIYLNNYKINSIEKLGGYYVYTNLKEDIYKINISPESKLYFDECMIINLKSLNKLNPLVNIRLKRRKISFLKKDTTVVKIKMFNKNKVPVENVDIKAFLYGDNYFVGQVVNEKIKTSTDEILIDELYEEFFPGDSLYLGNEENGEFLTILNKLDNKKYKLMEPLKNKYDYGKKFYKAFISKTDSEGNGLIYFRNVPKSKNKIKIIINYKGILKEVLFYIEENKLINTDEIFL